MGCLPYKVISEPVFFVEWLYFVGRCTSNLLVPPGSAIPWCRRINPALDLNTPEAHHLTNEALKSPSVQKEWWVRWKERATQTTALQGQIKWMSPFEARMQHLWFWKAGGPPGGFFLPLNNKMFCLVFSLCILTQVQNTAVLWGLLSLLSSAGRTVALPWWHTEKEGEGLGWGGVVANSDKTLWGQRKKTGS